jgi:uncharacterized membrane protein YozB (DUF420 family)
MSPPFSQSAYRPNLKKKKEAYEIILLCVCVSLFLFFVLHAARVVSRETDNYFFPSPIKTLYTFFLHLTSDTCLFHLILIP